MPFVKNSVYSNTLRVFLHRWFEYNFLDNTSNFDTRFVVTVSVRERRRHILSSGSSERGRGVQRGVLVVAIGWSWCARYTTWTRARAARTRSPRRWCWRRLPEPPCPPRPPPRPPTYCTVSRRARSRRASRWPTCCPRGLWRSTADEAVPAYTYDYPPIIWLCQLRWHFIETLHKKIIT